jgi:type VII secretion-associated serine protease mycosin
MSRDGVKAGRALPRFAALAASCGLVVATGLACAPAASASASWRPTAADVPTNCQPDSPNLAPTDPGPALLWAGPRLGLDDKGAWSVSRGAGVTVAVVDTGVDKDDPAFAPGTVLPGVSTLAPDTGDYDCDGHGTAVAAVIAGRESGVFGFSGVAPDARILPIRQAYKKSGDLKDIVSGIRKAEDLGARIVNVSLTSTVDSPELEAVVADAQARGVLIVAAAGNGTASGVEGRMYPAAIPGVLAVGAVERDGSVTSFSQKDTGVLVAAPGGKMAVPAVGCGKCLTVEQGTSFAAPYVAGVAALILSRHPDLTPQQVIRRIEATADRPAASPLPDATLGWGVVNPYRALTAVLPDDAGATPATVPVGHAAAPSRSAAVDGSTTNKVTLALLGAGLLALAVPMAAVTLRRGRARGWRAGS